MKHIIKNIFHSPRFVIGFAIFCGMLLFTMVYPLFVTADPLEMVGQGNFFKPGTYVSVKDAVNTEQYMLNIAEKAENVGSRLTDVQKTDMRDWLVRFGGITQEEMDASDDDQLVVLWMENYDAEAAQEGLLATKKRQFVRMNEEIRKMVNDTDLILAEEKERGELEKTAEINSRQYVNVKDVANKRTLILGTDNFGRDVLTELVQATKTSLKIGLIAGIVATLIGLMLGLISGYVGGVADDFIMFVANLFTVIPSFVMLILITYSIGQAARGVTLIAVVIGFTSWTWTCRSVRSQVISLRNRDHVSLSKLSGHSMMRIVLTDILPYVASYVVMALILQISSGILAEAQLSMLGLGPSTTTTATLGQMMNWATMYAAHLNGAWWAYFPVVFVIAMISFSLSLMNTGLDQVFNPQLRD